MTTPIGNNLQTLFEDVRQTAYKRGHLSARLELLKAIETIEVEQRSALYALTEVMKHLEGIQTPHEPKKETRGRKKKIND
jgi:hypothetical protein